MAELVRQLELGRPVVIPTDTVCGLALMVTSNADPAILFDIKQRPVEKSIPWLVGSIDDLISYTQALPDWAIRMAGRHWPGALTLVCQASALVPAAFVAADSSIALRMPDHPLVLDLLKSIAAPLACTSANISSQPPVSRVADLDPRIIQQVAAVLDDTDYQKPEQTLPSTIVSCLGDQPEILRQGDLTLAQLLSD
jgi:tRNA threonylcarbamoyl adenosine modification protein (Sua5/YciO/YrdC/YwlC family)